MSRPWRPPSNIAWSYSRLKNYETCPRRHFHCDLKKDYAEKSEQLAKGEEIHTAMENALKGEPLPVVYSRFQPWVDRVLADSAPPCKLLVEEQYAIRRGPNGEFIPTNTKDYDRVWFRTKADAVILGEKTAWVIDWKTGARNNVDVVQLAIVAQCVMVYYPGIERVTASFVYLEDGSSATDMYTQDELNEMWQNLMPRVARYTDAVRAQAFPATPNFLCGRYCPVTECEHHGKQYRR